MYLMPQKEDGTVFIYYTNVEGKGVGKPVF